MDHLQISTLSIILRTYVFPFIINGFISFEHGQTTRFSRQIAMQSLHLLLKSSLSGTEILGSYYFKCKHHTLRSVGLVSKTGDDLQKTHVIYIVMLYLMNLTRIEINYVHIFEFVESFSFLDSHCDNCNIQEQLRQCST